MCWIWCLTYLSINGRCNRSVVAVSNGLIIRLVGGVGVLTMGNELNVPFCRLRMDVGVWNSRDRLGFAFTFPIVVLVKFVIVVVAWSDVVSNVIASLSGFSGLCIATDRWQRAFTTDISSLILVYLQFKPNLVNVSFRKTIEYVDWKLFIFSFFGSNALEMNYLLHLQI